MIYIFPLSSWFKQWRNYPLGTQFARKVGLEAIQNMGCVCMFISISGFLQCNICICSTLGYQSDLSLPVYYFSWPLVLLLENSKPL